MTKQTIQDRVQKIKNIDVEMTDIEVGERFRKDHGDIEALAQSISKEGLIHPIAIVLNSKQSGQHYKLIAGGRRFKALEFIKAREGIETVSCRLYDRELTELELRTLEFAENLYRKDLSWQEECRLKERILDLQQRIHGVRVSTAPNAPGYSLTDMAKMTGRSKGSLSEDISLAKMMISTPEVNWNQFETKADARKALKTAKKKIVQTAEAKQAKATLGTGDSLKKKLIDSYHVIDFFEGVKKIGNSTMDLVELDPPYAINLESQKKGYAYTGYNEIDPEKYATFMTKVFQECYRVLKPNSWLLCWFGPDWFEPMHQWICEAGFKNKRIPGLWIKGVENQDGVIRSAPGQVMQPDRDLAKGYEMFFYARKGVPTINIPGTSNVFGFKPVPAMLKTHPTERPIELILELLRVFAQPNSNILVPFAGSGNTLIASALSKMLPIGYDLTEEYKDGYIIKVHKLL
jgi:ParB/RepB/Spo0J family partition protein